MERNLIPPYTPKLNGIAERAGRTLIESARAMLHYGTIAMQFRAEAVAYAADIRKRFLCPRNDYKTSSELLTGKKHRVDHIRAFGSRAWTLIPTVKRAKLDSKSLRGIVVECFDAGL